jgi:deoxycytidine triphosphate deaminase
MFLTKEQLKNLITAKEIEITPFDPANLKDASYTFTLGSKVKTLKEVDSLDSRRTPLFDESEISEEGHELLPGAFAIFHTKERVTLKGKCVCLLSTRGSIAHMGLDAIQSSSFAEPDTDNEFALEISNNGLLPVRLYVGTPIVKGVFVSLK